MTSRRVVFDSITLTDYTVSGSDYTVPYNQIANKSISQEGTGSPWQIFDSQDASNEAPIFAKAYVSRNQSLAGLNDPSIQQSPRRIRIKYQLPDNELISDVFSNRAGFTLPKERCLATYTFRWQMMVDFRDSSNQGFEPGTRLDNINYTAQPQGMNANTTSLSYESGLYTIRQSGNDVGNSPGLNEFTFDNLDASYSITMNLPYNQVTYYRIGAHYPVMVGTLTRQWEVLEHNIDGLQGDSVVFEPVRCALSAIVEMREFGEAKLDSEFTITEQSINKIFTVPLSVSTTSALTIQPSFKHGANKNLQISTEILASTENIVRLDSLVLSNIFTQTVVPRFKPSIGETAIAAVTNAVSTPGLIYDINADYSWNTFNLNIYFESGFVEDGFVSDQGEYNWNYLETTAWDDWPTVTWIGNEATWDNWPDDVWEKTYTLGWRGVLSVTPSFKLGDTVSYTGAFTFAEDSAYKKEGIPDAIESAFTTSFTAAGRIDVSIELTGAFAPDLTANIKYGLGEKIEITGAFTPVLTANARTDTFADIDVAFALAVSPTFKPSAYQETYTAQSAVEINPTFKPAGFADLLALASTLTVSRLFYQTDPYNIHTILQDTRTVMVPAENRQTDVLGENRVNTIVTETRGYRVPQETRSLKLRIPPFKNIFTTPRIRQET